MSKKYIYHLILVLVTVVIFFSSCATTSLVGWKDPKYTGPQFKSIFVIAFVNDLSDRYSLEDNLVTIFKSYNLNSVASLKVISPSDSLTFDKAESLLDVYKIDAIMTVKITSVKDINSYVPPTTTYYSYYSYYWGWWGGGNFVSSPGYYVKTGEDVKIETKLFDNVSNGLVWQGQSESVDYQSTGSIAFDLGKKIYNDWKLYNLVK